MIKLELLNEVGGTVASKEATPEFLTENFENRFKPLITWLNFLTSIKTRKGKDFVFKINDTEIPFKGGRAGAKVEQYLAVQLAVDEKGFDIKEIKNIVENTIDSMQIDENATNFIKDVARAEVLGKNVNPKYDGKFTISVESSLSQIEQDV